jgi:hypothetical protein
MGHNSFFLNKRCFQLAEIDDMDHMTPRSHLNYFSENNSLILPCLQCSHLKTTNILQSPSDITKKTI